MKSVLISLLFCVALLGQSITPILFPTPAPYQDLKQYLGLTESQYQGLLSNQSSYQTLVFSKQRRVAQVYAEISEETAREKLDAMALGVRYLELEVNCREMTEAYAKLRTQNLTLLNDAQKLKLKSLEDALKLSNAIGQAQQVNLLPGNVAFPLSTIGSLTFGGITDDTITAVLGGFPLYAGATLPGCRAPNLIPANRIVPLLP